MSHAATTLAVTSVGKVKRIVPPVEHGTGVKYERDENDHHGLLSAWNSSLMALPECV